MSVRKTRVRDTPAAPVRQLSAASQWYIVWTQETGMEFVYAVDGSWDWVTNVAEQRPCREGMAPPWVGTWAAAFVKMQEIARVRRAWLHEVMPDPGEKLATFWLQAHRCPIKSTPPSPAAKRPTASRSTSTGGPISAPRKTSRRRRTTASPTSGSARLSD